MWRPPLKALQLQAPPTRANWQNDLPRIAKSPMKQPSIIRSQEDVQKMVAVGAKVHGVLYATMQF